MNKIITLALAVVLFLVGAFVGNKMGASGTENMYLKSGTAMYQEPTAYSERKILAKNIDVAVLEKVKYGAPTVVYVNDDITAKSDSGESYKLKKGSFFKFVGVNEAEDMATSFAKVDDNKSIQLVVPKRKLYPVDEGEWLRVIEEFVGEKWVRIKSFWYDNI